MTSQTASPTPGADAGDISARSVWLACIAIYLLFMAVAWYWPGLLQGPGRHPVTGEPNWEMGLLEQAQNVTLLISLVLALALLPRAETRLMRGWLVLVALGSLWLLGEETSWGQHYMGWGASGWFAQHNDQNETNLHNTSYWLDQAPRALLQVGMLVGGVLHPLLKLARRGKGLIDTPWWLAPTIVCMAPVIVSLIAGAPKAIDKLALLPFQLQFYRASEMEECFVYAFFVVYLLSLGARLRFRRRQT